MHLPGYTRTQTGSDSELAALNIGQSRVQYPALHDQHRVTNGTADHHQKSAHIADYERGANSWAVRAERAD